MHPGTSHALRHPTRTQAPHTRPGTPHAPRHPTSTQAPHMHPGTSHAPRHPTCTQAPVWAKVRCLLLLFPLLPRPLLLLLLSHTLNPSPKPSVPSALSTSFFPQPSPHLAPPEPLLPGPPGPHAPCATRTPPAPFPPCPAPPAPIWPPCTLRHQNQRLSGFTRLFIPSKIPCTTCSAWLGLNRVASMSRPVISRPITSTTARGSGGGGGSTSHQTAYHVHYSQGGGSTRHQTAYHIRISHEGGGGGSLSHPLAERGSGEGGQPARCGVSHPQMQVRDSLQMQVRDSLQITGVQSSMLPTSLLALAPDMLTQPALAIRSLRAPPRPPLPHPSHWLLSVSFCALPRTPLPHPPHWLLPVSLCAATSMSTS